MIEIRYTFLTAMTNLFFTKVMVISFILLFSLFSRAWALDFSFEFPEKVQVNESFAVNIALDSQETYDIKIYSQVDNKIISQIYNNGWKSSFNYLKQSFPQQTSYKVRILKTGDYSLCVKLRDLKSKVFEKCSFISVSKKEEKEEEEESIVNQKNEASQDYEINQQQDYASQSLTRSINYINKNKSEDNIILISKESIRLKNTNEFLTSIQKTRIAIVCSFFALLLIVVLILLIRKL